MSSKSGRNPDNTNSGQGSLGMGGQPDDLARDNESGGGGDLTREDLGGGTGPLKGASGSTHGGGVREVAGVPGDKDMTPIKSE